MMFVSKPVAKLEANLAQPSDIEFESPSFLMH